MPLKTLLPEHSCISIENESQKFLKQFFPDSLEYFDSLDFLKFYHTSIFDIGYRMDIVSDFEMRNILGSNVLAITVPEQKVIIFPESTYNGIINCLNRARFTAGHEIGHLVLHSHLNYIFYDIKDVDKTDLDLELEADFFSASILMPFQHIKRIILLNGNIKHISAFFQVSEESAILRYLFVKKRLKNLNYKF